MHAYIGMHVYRYKYINMSICLPAVYTTVAPMWLLTDYAISNISVPIPIRYSDIYKSSLTLAHSVKYAIFAFLKRRLAQRCCNFCRSCCILCLNLSFECCAYLSAWCSDAAPVNLLPSLLANITCPVL